MAQQTDPAVPTRLSSVIECLEGNKLRVAGRMLSYDGLTGIMLLSDQDHAVLVDVSLCLDEDTGWARERKGVVMAVGYVERSEEPLAIPELPAYCPAPAVDPCVVIRAVLVAESGDLDLRLWNEGIDERERA